MEKQWTRGQRPATPRQKLHDPNRPGHGQKHRLLTTLLDEMLDPAKTLIELYHVRWEEELTIDETKTHELERLTLRSQTPAGVVQELYALLIDHFFVRVLMFEAARTRDLAPVRMSFTGTLKILRCRVPECPRRLPGQRRWWRNLLEEIGEEVLEPRRNRINPRVIKRKMSKWKKKRREHRRYPLTNQGLPRCDRDDPLNGIGASVLSLTLLYND